MPIATTPTTIRLPVELHATLKAAAERAKEPLSTYLATLLERAAHPATDVAAPTDLSPLTDELAALRGDVDHLRAGLAATLDLVLRALTPQSGQGARDSIQPFISRHLGPRRDS